MVKGRVTHEYYAKNHNWQEDEVGIDLPTLLHWLVMCLVVYKMGIKETERFLIIDVLEDEYSTLKLEPSVRVQGIVCVSYELELGKKPPGFTCAIAELPLMKRWLDKSRRDSDVEKKK